MQIHLKNILNINNFNDKQTVFISTILNYISYHSVLYCTVQYHSVSYHVISYHIVPYRTILYQSH